MRCNAVKKRLWSWCVALIFLVNAWNITAFAESVDENPVKNAGFENISSDEWVAYNTAGIDSDHAHTGEYCARVEKGSGYEQTLYLKPDSNYVLTAWAKAEKNGSVMTLGVKNYGGPETFSATVSDVYEKLTVTFTTGADASAAVIYGYRQDNGAGAGYFDDVELVEVESLEAYRPLVNAAEPLVIPTYEGSDQPTHPSVVKFDEPWNGYIYWMAMTPYPYNDGSFENPSIVASDDGIHWIEPDGVENPLVETPKIGHNCDADLVYVPSQDELRIYYVDADDRISSRVKMMRSSDGVVWSEPQIVMKDLIRKYSILSPSVEVLPDGTFMMWYVDAGNAGWNSQKNEVKYCTSADGIKWSGATTCTDFVQPGYQIWHIDVHYEENTGTYYAVFPAYPNGTDCDHCNLFFAVNRTGNQWEMFSKPVLKPSSQDAWDDFCIYRSSLLIEDGALTVWYGAKKRSDSSWHTGVAQRSFDEFISILES